jgi:hypothetical protein
MMLIRQTQRQYELPDARLVMVASDATFLKFQNVMNASKNLSMGLMFLIRVPEVIPLVLLAFAHSRRLADILNFLLSLGKYALWNAFCLHIGEVDLLLLRALYGRFEYRGLSPRFTEQQVIELVALILTVRSRFEVDRAICDLTVSAKAGKFSPNGPLAIETINPAFRRSTRTRCCSFRSSARAR